MTTKSPKAQTKKKSSKLSASVTKKGLTLMEMTNIEYLFELSETLFGCWASTESLICERNPLDGIEDELLDEFKDEDGLEVANEDFEELAAMLSENFDVLYSMASDLQDKARRLAELTGQKIRNDWMPA